MLNKLHEMAEDYAQPIPSVIVHEYFWASNKKSNSLQEHSQIVKETSIKTRVDFVSDNCLDSYTSEETSCTN